MDNNIIQNVEKKDKDKKVSILEMRRKIPGYRIHDGITSMTNEENVDKSLDRKNMRIASPNREILSPIKNLSNSKPPKYIRKYGWAPDIPDHRDRIYSDYFRKVEEKVLIPEEDNPIREYTTKVESKIISPLPSVDLRSMDSPIFDQGSLGSCTGNALAGALQFLEKKDKIPYTELSRLFIYFDERVVENTVNIDSGASLRNGIKTLAKLGVCSETCWPYDIQNFAVQPGHKCYIEASKHRILSYYRLNILEDMTHCLDNGYPFDFGFSVYSSFENEEVANTGIVNMPTVDEQLLGGHAVMAIGYDMNKKIFPESIGSVLCRNSWGVSWGIGGYFWLPFEYLTNRNLSDDLWTIRRGMNL